MGGGDAVRLDVLAQIATHFQESPLFLDIRGAGNFDDRLKLRER